MVNYLNRRRFISVMGLTSASMALGFKPFYNNRGPSARNPLCVFSKCMQWLNYDDMASLTREIGFDGIDLTVRPNGHVLPERVKEDLPKAVAAIEKAGLKVYMLTTAIKSANEVHTENILSTAASLGIKYYRTDWFNYRPEIDVLQNLSAFKEQLHGLQVLNKKYNMHGAYQNHAGAYFGSAVWDLWETIKNLDPNYIGCQYDIRHATVEAPDTWPLCLALLRPHIHCIAIKDFSVQQVDGKITYAAAPLATGMADFRKYLGFLKSFQYHGPQSMHFEYPLGGAEEGSHQITISNAAFAQALKTDLIRYKNLLYETGL